MGESVFYTKNKCNPTKQANIIWAVLPTRGKPTVFFTLKSFVFIAEFQMFHFKTKIQK